MKKFTTIKQYIKSLPEEQRRVINELDTEIKKTVPNLKQKLWEQKFGGGKEVHIIGYGEYHTTYASGRKVNWFLIGLTANKNDFSIYINSVKNGKYLVESKSKKLGKAKTGKSSIKFKSIEDLNLDEVLKTIKEASKNL